MKGDNLKIYWASLTPKERTELHRRKCNASILFFKTHPEALKKRGEAIKANHKGSAGKHWKLSEETRKRQSLAQKGENNPAWRGGVTQKNWGWRLEDKYKKWRAKVIKRDGGRCVICEDNRRLEVDHIKPAFLFPDLKFSVDNGRTLCHECHTKTDTYAGRVLSSRFNPNLFQRNIS